MNSKILVISAHPDDEILGCGGTVARLIKEGCKVHTLILGEGVTSRYKSRSSKRQSDITALKRQARQINRLLGVEKVHFRSFPDNRFDTVPLLDIVKDIEDVKREVKPDVIFTHYEKDLNIDHQVVYKAVITATRPTPEETVSEIYSFEVSSSTEWSYPPSFMPDVFFDISKTIDLKLDAVKIYKSELKNYPHPRSLKGVALISKYWGVRIGVDYAEAFKAVRIIK